MGERVIGGSYNTKPAGERSDPIQTVREALSYPQAWLYPNAPAELKAERHQASAALDRIEAVVKAARDVRYDVMNEGFVSQATSDAVHAALAALDSQEEGT